MEVYNAIGRRKTSVARIYLKKGKGKITVNKKDVGDYFKTVTNVYKLHQPFVLTENEKSFDVDINVRGGGITGQAEAARLGISRALVEINPEFRSVLKAEGLLTRDSRMVERKKPGQKKARKKFQFSKR